MTRRKEYIGFSHQTYLTEAHVIQRRTSDMAWAWIKERRPSWQENSIGRRTFI
jgi:hypothetical protein